MKTLESKRAWESKEGECLLTLSPKLFGVLALRTLSIIKRRYIGTPGDNEDRYLFADRISMDSKPAGHDLRNQVLNSNSPLSIFVVTGLIRDDHTFFETGLVESDSLVKRREEVVSWSASTHFQVSPVLIRARKAVEYSRYQYHEDPFLVKKRGMGTKRENVRRRVFEFPATVILFYQPHERSRKSQLHVQLKRERERERERSISSATSNAESQAIKTHFHVYNPIHLPKELF